MLLESYHGDPRSHAALSRPGDEQVEAEELAPPEEVIAEIRSTPGECSVTGAQIFAQTVVPDRRLWNITKSQANLTLFESIFSLVICISLKWGNAKARFTGTMGLGTLFIAVLRFCLAYALFARVVGDRPCRGINLALFGLLLILFLVWLTLGSMVLTDTGFGELPCSKSVAFTLAELYLPGLTWVGQTILVISRMTAPPDTADAKAGVQVMASIAKYNPDAEEPLPSTCAICLDDFEAGGSVAVLSCGHVFHKGCIGDWVSLGRTCPLRCGQTYGDAEEGATQQRTLASMGRAL